MFNKIFLFLFIFLCISFIINSHKYKLNKLKFLRFKCSIRPEQWICKNVKTNKRFVNKFDKNISDSVYQLQSMQWKINKITILCMRDYNDYYSHDKYYQICANKDVVDLIYDKKHSYKYVDNDIDNANGVNNTLTKNTLHTVILQHIDGFIMKWHYRKEFMDLLKVKK